jgi:hypothetical protein
MAGCACAGGGPVGGSRGGGRDAGPSQRACSPGLYRDGRTVAVCAAFCGLDWGHAGLQVGMESRGLRGFLGARGSDAGGAGNDVGRERRIRTRVIARRLVCDPGADIFVPVELTGVRSCRDPVELVDEACGPLARLPPAGGGPERIVTACTLFGACGLIPSSAARERLRAAGGG